MTAEFGCLRLERLSGEEEVTGDQLFLPLPADYNYGLTGPDTSSEATRAVFGLLASELEQLVSVLRRGSFPVLGFSQRDLRCSLTCCTIPGYWPHVVTSNMALHGNVVSLEAFMRLMVASLPQARLSARFPRPAAGVRTDDAGRGEAAPGRSLHPGDAGADGGAGAALKRTFGVME